ncbi:MAG: hypothetical protein IKV41_04425 [Oscillospiraceae bacterium]|nr:hypothetical protein [Oscillospiraceae bacterium]
MKPEKQRFVQVVLYCANALVLLWGFLIVGILSVGMEKPTISEIEKRTLAAKPVFSVESFFSGQFSRDFEAYYADTFPCRDALVQTASAFNSLKGVTLGDMRVYETNAADTGAPANGEVAPASSVSADTTAEAKNDAENTSFLPPDDENITGEQIGSSFVYKDMALPIFWENPDAAKRYADCLAKYAERLDGKAKVYNLVIPSSIEFYLPKRYKSVTSPQRKNINSIYELMDDKITTVDAYSEIAAHTSEYLYFRTDHHWTARGAYYAYKAFAKAAGLTPTPLESMELRTLDKPFLGTLYSQTQDSNLAQNPDTLEYFIPSVNAVNYQYLTGSPYSPNKTTVWAEYAVGIYSYSLFLHGDFPLSHIQTENRNGKNILMVKESFGNAFAPFLINNYENIYVVDQRYFQLNLPAFVEQNNIQEVLFINNIFAAQTDIRTHELSRLFT